MHEDPGGLTCRKCGLLLADHIHALVEGAETCEGEFGTREEMISDFRQQVSWRSFVAFFMSFLLHPIAATREVAWGMRYQTARNLEISMQETCSLEHSRMVRELVLSMSWWRFGTLFATLLMYQWGSALLGVLGLTRLLRFFRKDEE